MAKSLASIFSKEIEMLKEEEEEEQERFAAQSAQKLLAAQTPAAPSANTDDTGTGLAHGATSTMPGPWPPRQENTQEECKQPQTKEKKRHCRPRTSC